MSANKKRSLTLGTPLQREYDRTGTFVLGNDVQLGFCVDDSGPRKELPLPPATRCRSWLNTEYTARHAHDRRSDAERREFAGLQLIGRFPDIDNIKQELFGPNFKATECEDASHFPDPNIIAEKMSFCLGHAAIPGCCGRSKRRTGFRADAEHFKDGARQSRAIHHDVRRPDLRRHAQSHVAACAPIPSRSSSRDTSRRTALRNRAKGCQTTPIRFSTTTRSRTIDAGSHERSGRTNCSIGNRRLSELPVESRHILIACSTR